MSRVRAPGGERVAWWGSAVDDLPCASDPELVTALERLHAVNARQWDAEDETRATDDRGLSAVKHEIDRLNARRHELIELVDRILERQWAARPDAPPLTESIGSALDRLSVLTLRVLHASRRSPEDAQLVMLLERQRQDLVAAIAVACHDLRAGFRRAPSPERIKLYGAAE